MISKKALWLLDDGNIWRDTQIDLLEEPTSVAGWPATITGRVLLFDGDIAIELSKRKIVVLPPHEVQYNVIDLDVNAGKFDAQLI